MKEGTMKKFRFIAVPIFLITTILSGCVDDTPVAYNEYEIINITPPVDKQGTAGEKKVHIGHDLPVNITLKARYPEDNVPIQFYLLNADDAAEVESGSGLVSDIRMYYIQQTSLTTIAHIEADTNTYSLIINIPSDDARDKFTGDFKVGTYYMVGEVNKYEEAEIDAYAVYQKFKDKLDTENRIVVTSDYMKKPDLSIESMHFTGGQDNPNDVLVFYNLVLNNLPGGESLPTIYVSPSETDRAFVGTVHVKSSSSDALNVPVIFRLINADGTISVPLDIYDRSMGGWVDTYYIPILKANTTERISLGLRIPEDKGPVNYFDENQYDNWPSNPTSTDISEYPLTAIRHALPKDTFGSYSWKIAAEVNPGGEVTESRFIAPNSTGQYDENDYYENGDIYDTTNPNPAITKENNISSESITLALERIEVKPNEGIKAYPYAEMDPPDPDYRTLVIFWDGFAVNVGDNTFGASAEMHEGMFFYNYSLYSLGIDIHGTVFGSNMYLVNTYLDAESHPFDESKSGYAFHIEGFQRVVMSEAGAGFSENRWSYPILLWGKEVSKSQWVYAVKFTLTAGIETYLTPGINLDINSDGSLTVDKYTNLTGSVYADASASIAGLASVGLYTYIDVLGLELIQSAYTVTEFDEANHPGAVKGTLNRDVGFYIVGPKGYMDIYFEIDFILFSKRWSKELYSFSYFRIPLLEMDFLGSGESTNWIKLNNTDITDYNTPQ